jgi:hypothetical protein
MSADHEVLNLAGPESDSQTLFDELAGLVPDERLAEYYRVSRDLDLVETLEGGEFVRFGKGSGS